MKVNNATINITNVDSTITLNNLVLDYGESVNVTVATTYATGITAKIDNVDVSVVNNFTIQISDLNAGNHTLTVTTITEENHNPVTKEVNITVNRINATLTVDDVVLDYGDSRNVTVTAEGATGVTAKINGNDVEVIDNYTISVSGLGAGNYTLTVTTVPDKNHSPVTVNATITVNRVSTEISIIYELLNLNVNDTIGNFSALTPEDAGSLNYTSSDENVAKIVDDEIIAVGPGKAKITVSFKGNDNYSDAEDKSFYVIVKQVNSSISINKTKFELVIGDEADIIANATPEGLIIDYATDDTDIVSVDQNGHITALSNGTAIIFVSVGDNLIYAFAYDYVVVNVKKTTEIDVNVSSEENKVTVTATVDSSASGLVKFDIGGKIVHVEVENGKAVYNTNLPAGDYIVEATYMGDYNFKSNTTSKQFTVADPIKKNITLDLNVTVNNYDVTITLTADVNVTGLVEFKIANNAFMVQLDGGKTTVNLMLPTGNYTAEIKFLGNEKYNPATTTAEIKISEDKIIVELKEQLKEAQNNASKLAEDLDDANAKVDNLTGELADANAKVDNLTGQLEDANAKVDNLTRELADAKVNLSDANNKIDDLSGELADAKVNLSDANNKIDNLTGQLEDANAKVDNLTRELADAKVNITGLVDDIAELNNKVDALTVELEEAKSNTAVVETKVASQFNVTNGFKLQVYAVDYKAGERGAMFDVLLTDSNGNRLVNQSVVFAINGAVHSKTTDANGVAHLQINLQDANYYTCAPCYLGNTKYNATFASAMIEVIKKPITITAAAKSYKATAKTKKYSVTLKTIVGNSNTGKAIMKSGKTVKLTVNGKTYTTKTNGKGQATFKITNLNKIGKYTAVIKFAGDKTYKAASKKISINIK